ncbi:MAG: HAD-IIIC family phosphatase, partial [Candidatus Omnitrophica bacterium]|nr:HAD-IIIC family phosphatase [Candidatus Omnitrophota bacterium]
LLSISSNEPLVWHSQNDSINLQWEIVWAFVNSVKEEDGDRERTRRDGKPSYVPYWVGKNSFERFMKAIGAKIMVRGHDKNASKDLTLFGGKFVTIISTGKQSSGSGKECKEIIARYAEFDLAKGYNNIIPIEVIRVLEDPARPLPGQPMPSAVAVKEEVLRHDINKFQVLAVNSEELKLALAYLRSIGEPAMADYLEYLAKAGFIRTGPLKGFLASSYIDSEGVEYIFISYNYPGYNNFEQMVVSLIHEIGATSRFNKTHHENEQRGEDFIEIIKLVNKWFDSARERGLSIDLLKEAFYDMLTACENKGVLRKAIELELAYIGSEKRLNKNKSDIIEIIISCTEQDDVISDLTSSGYLELEREYDHQDLSDYPEYTYVWWRVIFAIPAGKITYEAIPAFSHFANWRKKNKINILIERLYEICVVRNRIHQLAYLVNLGAESLRISEFNDREWIEFVNRRFPLGKKCIILDCDGVLWQGIVGEDSWEGIHIYAEHSTFQSALKEFKKRGVILAINSNNNLKDVEEVFERRRGMLLKIDDFSSIRVNWQNKAENIREIINELNIGLDSAIFIDDSPQNRELVKNILPEVWVFDFPALTVGPAALIRELKDMFMVDSITPEDKDRADLYKAKASRERERQELQNEEAFYRSLKMKVVIREGDRNIKIMPRLAQMSQRINQFNLTTRRYKEEDFRSILGNSNYATFTLEYLDKFGKSGLVGLIVCRKIKDRAWEIDEF